MPRRKPDIHVNVVWEESDDPRVVDRWVNATKILLRASQRREEANSKCKTQPEEE